MSQKQWRSVYFQHAHSRGFTYRSLNESLRVSPAEFPRCSGLWNVSAQPAVCVSWRTEWSSHWLWYPKLRYRYGPTTSRNCRLSPFIILFLVWVCVNDLDMGNIRLQTQNRPVDCLSRACRSLKEEKTGCCTQLAWAEGLKLTRTHSPQMRQIWCRKEKILTLNVAFEPRVDFKIFHQLKKHQGKKKPCNCFPTSWNRASLSLKINF